MTKHETAVKDYWDKYYSEGSVGRFPSQFAAFVINEFPDREKFIDLGCGNGRDSFFFATNGKTVLGSDGSTTVIEKCREHVKATAMSNIEFTELSFSKAQSCDEFVAAHGELWSGAIIYARFFLHAINDAEEEEFFNLCHRLLGDNGKLCLEFRTDRDKLQPKVTGAHYRRFISPVDFISTVNRLGMKIEYYNDGFGMAKHKSDDAHVARAILSKND